MENIPQIDNPPTKRATLTGSKTVDVILGFLGNAGIGAYVLYLDNDNSFIFVGGLTIFFMILSWLLGKRYIFYGILGTLIVPLIVFGACFIMFSGGGGF